MLREHGAIVSAETLERPRLPSSPPPGTLCVWCDARTPLVVTSVCAFIWHFLASREATVLRTGLMHALNVNEPHSRRDVSSGFPTRVIEWRRRIWAISHGVPGLTPHHRGAGVTSQVGN
jgi:hypothetical protein